MKAYRERTLGSFARYLLHKSPRPQLLHITGAAGVGEARQILFEEIDSALRAEHARLFRRRRAERTAERNVNASRWA